MSWSSNRRRLGFTLVEMLVAIVVVAVLAALLLPSLGRAIKAGRSTKCASNLRQIGIALDAYAGENNQRFPLVSNENPTGETWIWQLKPYLGMSTNSMGFAPLPRAAGVFICPEFKPNAALRDVSYALNTCITTSSGRPWQYDRLRVRQSGTIVVAEIASNSEIYSPFSGGPVQRRHPGPSANYLFVDGHVENIAVLIPSTDKRWDPNLQ